MRKIIVSISLILFIFTSCEKNDENSNVIDFQSSTLVRQIQDVDGSEDFMEVFTYYNTGKIFEHLERYMYRKFLYNDMGLLEKVEIAVSINPLSCAIVPGTSMEDGDDPRKAPVSQYLEFDYDEENKLIQKTARYIYADIDQIMYYEQMVYDGDLILRRNTYNINDELTQFKIYGYDDRGNLIKEESYYNYFEEPEWYLSDSVVYECDTMPNPLNVFSPLCEPGEYTNPNNILKKKFYNLDNNGFMTFSHSFDYTFKYKSNGYPESVNNLIFVYGNDQ